MEVITAADQPAEPQRRMRLVLLGAMAFLLYAFLWPGVTGDMGHFLIPWLDHILTRGPVGAFSEHFSNYTPPYLYLLALVSPLAAVLSKVSLIKALSVAATGVLALAVRQLLRGAGGRNTTEAAFAVVLLPSVAVNAAGLGQCDAIWSAACVMAVASAVRGRSVAMLVWCGIAVSFKAQGLFLGPFVALRLVQDRTPLKYWAIPGFVYAGAMLPAALAGWPVADLASVYLRQAQWNPTLVSTAANPWSLAQYLAADSAYKWTWLGIAAAAGAGLGYIAAFRRRENSAADLVALALLSACLMPFLLPKMLERYFFLADVLAFALAILQRDRRSFAILGLVQGSSVLALAGVMLRAPLAPVIAMPMMLAAMLLLADRLRRGGALARCTAAEPG